MSDALDRARWNGTDSTFEGYVVSRFTKTNGKRMVVLEDDRGLCHIYPESDRLAIQHGEGEADMNTNNTGIRTGDNGKDVAIMITITEREIESGVDLGPVIDARVEAARQTLRTFLTKGGADDR